MGVERIVPAKLDLTVLDKIERAARFAIAHRFELEQNDIGETVINLEKIHVAARYSGHFESLGGGIGQADSERVGPGWNIVGRVRVPFGRARNRYRNVRHVARKSEARYHHRPRSEERRGGKECVSKCRYRW